MPPKGGTTNTVAPMIELTSNPIDETAVLRDVRSPLAGAVVLFLGTAREVTGSQRTLWLDYEAYADMARQELQRLEAEARGRWPLVGVSIVHRLGRVEIGESSVAIAVSSPHRQAAFEAGQWLIDQIKHHVPIWKKETWADGSTEWVHPGISSAETPPVATPEDAT